MSDPAIAQLGDRLRAERQPFDRLPVIDIGPLVDGSDPGQVAAEIRWALTHVGFMYATNHGVDPALVARAFAQARAFFDLPLADKLELDVARSGPAMRGYIRHFGENLDPGTTSDLKECFDVGPEASEVSAFFGPNPWPSALAGFRDTVSRYHAVMKKLAGRILRGVALSLDLPAGFFEPKMRDPISIQRLLHCPPQSGSIDERVLGLGAHTDFGNLTILAQDDVSGLQVLSRDGGWIEAPPLPGAFVVNIGDLIQRLTNDLYLANLHRVVNTSGRERYSLAFFLDADYDAVFAPLPRCVTADRPARYAPVTCGAHKLGRFEVSLDHLASARVGT